MKSLHSPAAVFMILAGLIAGGVAAEGRAGYDVARWDTAREAVCNQPGVLGSEKVRADSTEVANDCSAGSSRIVRASWWGGYLAWQPGQSHVTCFDVRFYDDAVCSPASLIAAYTDAVAETTRVGADPEGRPCFRYDLDVDVTVGPGSFWLSIQTGCRHRDPPKWGRLGDEVLDGCPSLLKPESEGTWELPPTFPDWEASQAFETGEPTPARETAWGRLRILYR